MLSILWLRRDLRLEDNLSLYFACQNREKIQPIFIFDQNILARFTNQKDRRISFILEALRKLDKELKKYNAELLVFYGDPKILLPKIVKTLQVKQVFAGKDYEPYGLSRDANISKEITLNLYNDHLLLEPSKVLKNDGGAYRVFTPYYRQWQNIIEPLDYADYTVKVENCFAESSKLKKILIDNQLRLLNLNEDVPGYQYEENSYWSTQDLNKKFDNFITKKISNYSTQRDYLANDGTSCLSPYLRFGLISVRKCYRAAILQQGAERWINELVWRDFYAMLLYYFPETINLEMQPQYRSIKWSQDKELLGKFVAGNTGFPVVDAAINELLRTGWMHNRARMIVASFMTKNLWLDWRLGEEFFAQHLMDYELSSNIGGWQWGASVGADAMPYFRIFNPYLQSQKFDPLGKYIRKFLPILDGLNNREIHHPSLLFTGKYCLPIVNYEASRKKAIEYFRKNVSN